MTKKNVQPYYTTSMDSSSDESHIPYYKRLGNLILSDISAGRLKEGDRLLSERDLARVHDLNVGTVRKALKTLCEQKLLHRIHGKGTFIRSMMSPQSTAQFYPFAPEPSQLPVDDISLVTKVDLLGLDLVDVPDKVVKAMGQDFEGDVCLVSRLIYMNNEPKVITYSYLNRSYYKALKELPLNEFKTNSLYVVFHKHFKIRTTRNREFISASVVRNKDAERLQIVHGSPVLTIDSISFDQNDVAFEYRVGICSTQEEYITRAQPISF